MGQYNTLYYTILRLTKLKNYNLFQLKYVWNKCEFTEKY